MQISRQANSGIKIDTPDIVLDGLTSSSSDISEDLRPDPTQMPISEKLSNQDPAANYLCDCLLLIFGGAVVVHLITIMVIFM